MKAEEEEEESEKEVKVMTMKEAEVNAEEEAESERMNERANERNRCIFLPSFHLANRASDYCQPLTSKKPTTNPTKYLHQYLADQHFKHPSFAHAWCEDAYLCRMVTQLCHLGVGGAR